MNTKKLKIPDIIKECTNDILNNIIKKINNNVNYDDNDDDDDDDDKKWNLKIIIMKTIM